MSNDIDPAALLSREATARALTNEGYPIAAATLRTMACRGGGPACRRFGRVAVYRWSDALAWAESRLSAPRRSACEADVHQSAA
jgi:hypothetical protein